MRSAAPAGGLAAQCHGPDAPAGPPGQPDRCAI